MTGAQDQPDTPPTDPAPSPARRPPWRRPLVWVAVAAVLVAVVAATVTLGVTSATADSSTGMLRVAHLSPVTPAVDMYVTGPDLPETLVAPGVAYRGTSPYLTEPAGTYTLTARPAGASPTSPPAVRVSVDVPAGTAQTAAFVDSATSGSPELQVLDDQTAPAAAGSTQVRVVQGANGVGALDIDLTGGPPLGRDLFYGSTTPYATVPARTWEVDVRSRLGSTTTETVPLSDGGVTTLFVGREPDGQLIVEAVPDAATVAGVPGPGTEPTSPPRHRRPARPPIPRPRCRRRRASPRFRVAAPGPASAVWPPRPVSARSAPSAPGSRAGSPRSPTSRPRPGCRSRPPSRPPRACVPPGCRSRRWGWRR